MKWYYQGLPGIPFESRTAARNVRDITEKTLLLCHTAIAKHGPIPGYVRDLVILQDTLVSAKRFLSREGT